MTLFAFSSALRTIKEQSFPITSSHLVHQSSAMISYKAIFCQLLVVMQISKSEILLEFIASVSCCDPDHVCKEEIQESLAYLTRRWDFVILLRFITNLIFLQCGHREARKDFENIVRVV